MSPFVVDDNIILTREGEDYRLSVQRTTNGIYHNDKKINGSSLIKNGDFFSISDYSFYYKDNQLYTDIRPDMGFHLVEYVDDPIKYEYPKFNRNTRVKTVVNDKPIKILDPPAVVKKGDTSIIARMVPSFVMIVIAIVLAQFGRASFLIMAGMMAVMSVVTAIVTVVTDRKKFKRDTQKRKDTYENYVERKREEFTKARQEELGERNAIYLS